MTLLFIFCGFVLATTFFFLRPAAHETGTHADIAERLAKLKANPAPDAFLGFCTRDEDTLYFVFEHGIFQLDYELNTPKKKTHEEAFRNIAAELGFAVTMTSYNDFPVLRVPIDADGKRAAQIGFEFTRRIFAHDESTIFEFLP